MKIGKYIANSGFCSRRKVVDLLDKRVVTVNDQVILDPATEIDPETDTVKISNKKLIFIPKGILLINKPVGVECTLGEPSNHSKKTIKQFLTKKFQGYVPCGRLDVNSSGLLIMSNDGDLVERLTHPRFNLVRIYEVKVRGNVAQDTLDRLIKGVKLEDGIAKATNAIIIENLVNATWVQIEVLEGRNRMVRRMFAKMRHEVVKLIRVAHGPFKLGNLKLGEKKHLPLREYERYKKMLTE